MLGIVLVLSLGQQYCLSPTGDCDVFAPWRGPRQNRFGWRSPPSGAFFELAPLSGAGMTAACACAAVTGAKGEAVSWTRSSAAYCTKEGLATTGLTTTSMVSCSTNLPRVESDGVGLGVLVERGLTNAIIQSEAIDNVAYTKQGVAGASVPTVTADQAVTPWGATTAERIQFGATAATQSSTVFQTSGTVFAGSLVGACSLYVRGNATSGTIQVAVDNGAAVITCVPCSFVSGTWSRCVTPFTSGAAAPTVIFGNDSRAGVCGTTSTVAADVFVGGVQCEADSGGAATSYIATTTVAVARGADIATVSLPSAIPVASLSYAVTSSINGTQPGNSGLLGLHNSGVGTFDTMIHASTSNQYDLYVGAAFKVGLITHPTGTPIRSYAFFNSSDTRLGMNGSNLGTSAASTAANPLNRLTVGTYAGGNTGNALYRAICVDPDPLRCR